MADVKISALTSASTPLAGTEVLPVVQSGTTKNVNVANLTAGRAVSAASTTLTGNSTALNFIVNAGYTVFSGVAGGVQSAINNPITSGSTAALAFYYHTGSAQPEGIRLDATGNLLVGVTTGSYKLTLNGQPGANGYTAWTNYSDARLKENVTDFTKENVLDKVCSLRPVTFNYNDKSGFDEPTRQRRISGFIAQELQQVFPDMVGTIEIDGTEYLDTNLSNLALYLLQAIKELKAKIDTLKAKK